jgi:hypothetical protein
MSGSGLLLCSGREVEGDELAPPLGFIREAPPCASRRRTGAVFRPLPGTSPKLAPLDIQGIVLKAKLHLDSLLRASQHCGNIKK